MSPVAIDADLVAKLTANSGELPLTDLAGNPIGYFVSPEEYARLQKARYDQAFADVTEEEVQQALADPRRHSMEEVFKLLGQE